MQASLFDTHIPEPVRIAPVVEHEPESKIILRSSQPLALELVRERIKAGDSRIVVCAPCGFGKSIVACKYFEGATRKRKKVWFLVDRQNLAEQMSNHLQSVDIEHAVKMSQHWKWDKDHRTQVASVQTVEQCGWDTDLDLLLVDEGHAMMRKSFIEFAKNHPKTRIISFTATPFHKDMGSIYQSVVCPTTTNKQISEGFLVPLKIYTCKSADMKGAKTSGGEWTDAEVHTRGRTIIGDIVTTWQEKTFEVFGGPVKTIVFPCTIAHGQEIADAFAASGYNFKVVVGKDTSDAKKAIVEDFKRPDSIYDGLISCGVLTRGSDFPDVRCGIDARPLRKSFSEFIQKIGRVQRAYTDRDNVKIPYDNGDVKTFALWLDHADNVGRFLPEMIDLFENGVTSLADPPDAKPPRKEPTKKEKKDLFCPKCHRLWDFPGDMCSCGYVRKKVSTVENVPGVMKEVILGNVKLASNRRDLWEQIVNYVQTTGKPETAEARAFYAFRDMAGVKPPSDYQREFWAIPIKPVSRAVKNEFMRKRLAYIKGKQT